jgi:DNA-binding NtrC family response regulator
MDENWYILVVEDDADERESILRFLRTEMYAAHGAPSGEAALQHLDRPVELVLTDVRMGATSGVDLLKAWKAKRPGTPFILMTAFADIGDAVDAMKSGACDYLIKPVNPPELLEKIEAAIETVRGDVQAQSSFTPLHRLERLAIEQTLAECEGNRTRTARLLGISVRTLQRKLRAWESESRSATSAP